MFWRAAIVVLFMLSLARQTSAQPAWDPVPAIAPKEHVAVGRGVQPQDYRSLETCLKEQQSAVGATYFAAIVQVTDVHGRDTPAANDAVPFVDELYMTWQRTRRLDPDRHVLVALGLENRAVAIHPGARWVDMGFERAVITKTIDESQFKTYARGGDYAMAVCVLARAVEDKLASLTAAADQKRAALKVDIERFRATSAQLAQRVSALKSARAKLAAAFRSDLARADEALDAAARDLGLERFSPAASSVTIARDALFLVQDRLHEIDDAGARLPALRDALEGDIAAVEARTSPTAAATREARAAITACLGRIAEIERAHEEGRIVGKPVEEIERCRNNATFAVRQADRSWWVMTRLLPGSGGAIALAFAVFAAVTLRRRNRRWHEELQGEIATWAKDLEHASARLLEIEQKHPVYFAPGAQRWSGDSEALDREAADAVNLTFLLFAEADRLLREARALSAGAGPLSAKPLRDALALLRTSPVVFETGEREKRRRIFLPLSERWEGTARTLLVDLDRSYERALAALDRLAELRDACERSVDDGARAAADALAACTARTGLGLPADHLTPRLAEATEGQRAATRACLSDPNRAIADLEPAIVVLREIARVASLGNDVVTRARGPLVETGKRLEAEVRRLRENGFRLDEPGLEVDRRLGASGRELRAIEQLVARGDEIQASERLSVVEKDLAQLGEQLAISERARAEVPPAVDEVKAAEAKLVERVPDAMSRLERLATEHPREAFAAESDNLQELRDLLSSLVKRREHALAEHAAQRYLSAVAHVAQMRQMLEAGDRLLSEVAAIEATLVEARGAARALLDTTRRLGEEIDACAPEGTPGPGDALRDRIRHERSRLSDFAELAERERPHWPRLSADLAAADRRLSAMLAEVRAENDALAQARAIASDLEQELRQIDAQVRDETRDRPHVSRAIADLRRQLKEWVAGFDDVSRSGTSCLEPAADARRALQRVRDLWSVEKNLIRTVETELDAATRERGGLSGRRFGATIAPRWVGIDSALQKARAALEAQRLDDALSHAQACRQTIAAETRRCQNEADLAELAAMRALEEQRRASAWASSSSSSSSSSLFGSSSSSSLFGSSSSSSSSSFGFGSSSFGSSSSGSSFGSSSSGGSSFGSSSSGGSSW